MTTIDQQAEELLLYLQNDGEIYTQFVNHIRLLKRVVNAAASGLALHKAQWHDDPETENYAEFHAPAIEQFPPEARKKTLLAQVQYLVENMEW